MISKILHPFGELRHVEVAMKGGESRGYGHAEFVDAEAAKVAQSKLNGFKLLARKLIITDASGNQPA
ncbi:hypothetical protein AAVH_09311 [Aphelenchoides avenae]|nr:hypothetical protein AAVH_09311 [Aphelenchus avenae]